MSKVLIVDFDDSFTHNIAELCQNLGLEFEVLHYGQINRELILKNNYKKIIWGPGPGHPSQYSEASKLLKDLFNEEIFHIGICLGHQLLFWSLGYEIINAPDKKHGRSSKFIIPRWPYFKKEDWDLEVEVQYYSSLAVKEAKVIPELALACEDGVILSGMGENFLSYQFHPESVGTSCPEAFIRGIL